MLTIFQVCFFVGTGLTLISFVFGSLFDVAGVDGFDLGIDLFDIDIFLPMSPVLIFLSLTVFGGVGWILLDTYPSIWVIVAFIIPITTAIMISWLIYHFVMVPLKKAQNTSAPDKEELIGIRATVTETIMKDGGYGEIRYVVNGNSFTAPAKDTKEEGIKAGNDVAICWIKDNVFYVVSIDDM